MSLAAQQLLAQGWYPYLHEFNLLPSRLLHASWVAHFSPHGAIEALRIAFDDETSLHRHWSAHILERLGLSQRPWLDNVSPALPLAILPGEPFRQLLELAGAVLVGGAIRHAIRRDEVLAIGQCMDPERLHFVRSRAGGFHPGLALPGGPGVLAFVGQIETLGAAALLRALQGSPDELFERLRLRLPMAALDQDLDPTLADSIAGLSAASALELMLSLTTEVAPEWLSFCTTTV